MAIPVSTSLIPTTPPHVSVNRVRIVDLPGISMDREVRGELAYHLLSALAITRYARNSADALQLPPAFFEDAPETRRELPRFVDGCLSSADASRRAAAEAIALRLGRNLGHILLALRRGDAVNQAARPAWTPDDWARWATVERVWLGGGIVSGRLGRRIVQHAQAFLSEAGTPNPPHVALSPGGREMALLGSVRYLPADAPVALCFDFGHTAAKRAVATLSSGALTRLHCFPARPVPGNWHVAPDDDRIKTGSEVVTFIAGTVAQTANDAAALGSSILTSSTRASGLDVMLSVAAYVEGGRVLGNGLYATLHTLAEDVRPLLAGAISARLNLPIRVHLIHDGTAAAAVHAGEPDSAVMVVGTALGVGFPPPRADGLLELREDVME